MTSPPMPCSAARRESANCGRDMASALQRAGGVVDGGPDADVSHTAADVAVHGEVDVLLARLLDLAQQRDGAHHLPRLAIAALGHVARHPGALHRLRLAAGDALDRSHLAAAD